MSAHTEFEVTLTTEMYRFLRQEARRLEVPLRYLVASVVLDTLEEASSEGRSETAVPALAG